MICRGSKLLEEAKTLGEYGIKDNDFIIIMVAKPKPAPSTAAAATEQEAKKEERLAREEFALTGGNKKLTKKERKRLEQDE